MLCKTDLNKLHTFYYAARYRNFSQVAAILYTNQSSISRQIQALEKQLGHQLFHRTTRDIILTEKGEILYHTASDIFARVSKAEMLMEEMDGKIKGTLRILTKPSLGTFWLLKILRSFSASYPEIRLVIKLGLDSPQDLNDRMNIWITDTPSASTDLRCEALLKTQAHFYATHEYLKEHGTPTTVDELRHHRMILHQHDNSRSIGAHYQQMLSQSKKYRSRFSPIVCDTEFGLVHAVKQGLGIGILYDYMVGSTDNLKIVLPELLTKDIQEWYLLYPTYYSGSKRVMVFKEYLMSLKKEKSRV